MAAIAFLSEELFRVTIGERLDHDIVAGELDEDGKSWKKKKSPKR
jgi:hypothetical protein